MQDSDILAEQKTAKPLEVFSGLTSGQQIDFAQDMLNMVKTPQQKEQLAATVVSTLTPQQQKNLGESLIGQPSSGMTDYLWAISISSFALVLLGVSAGIIVGVIGLKMSANDIQPVLTIFTAVVGFLGGLFVKSPIDSSNKTPQK